VKDAVEFYSFFSDRLNESENLIVAPEMSTLNCQEDRKQAHRDIDIMRL